MVGSEDWDLIYRFDLLGLERKDISEIATTLHQWHPKYQGCPQGIEFDALLKKNVEYFENTTSLVRNKQGWGVTE